MIHMGLSTFIQPPQSRFIMGIGGVGDTQDIIHTIACALDFGPAHILLAQFQTLMTCVQLEKGNANIINYLDNFAAEYLLREISLLLIRPSVWWLMLY